MSPPPVAVAYRARDYLAEHGIHLNDLVDRRGRSKTSWSLFLAGKREEQKGSPRADVEAVLRERNVPVPADLWEKIGPEPAGARRRPARPNTATPRPEVLMEAQFLSETVLAKHRLFRDPFAPEAIADADGKPRLMNIYLSAAHRAALMRLTQVITRAGMMALYGQPGVGKSLLRDRALHDAAELTAGKLIVVAPANIERRRMTAHHIVAELLRQLADSPDQVTPRNVNARDAMLAEVLLRLYKAGHRVILAIDEAHELPIETLKDLKRLHEVRHGYLALLGILLVGQHELRTRMDPERSPILTEVALRCTTMELGPMIERGEVRGYIAARLALVGDAKVDALFEDDAIMEIERRLGVHRQQIALQVNNCATAALNRANVLGDDRVTAEHVEDVFSATREELQRWGSA